MAWLRISPKESFNTFIFLIKLAISTSSSLSFMLFFVTKSDSARSCKGIDKLFSTKFFCLILNVSESSFLIFASKYSFISLKNTSNRLRTCSTHSMLSWSPTVSKNPFCFFRLNNRSSKCLAPVFVILSPRCSVATPSMLCASSNTSAPHSGNMLLSSFNNARFEKNR